MGDVASYQKGRHTIAELIVIIFHGLSPLFFRAIDIPIYCSVSPRQFCQNSDMYYKLQCPPTYTCNLFHYDLYFVRGGSISNLSRITEYSEILSAACTFWGGPENCSAFASFIVEEACIVQEMRLEFFSPAVQLLLFSFILSSFVSEFCNAPNSWLMEALYIK